MLDGFCYVVGIILAIAATALVAFPDHVIPGGKERKKRVGARQWGIYHGSAPRKPGEEDHGIDVLVPARKERSVYGSATYQAGRGVRMG